MRKIIFILSLFIALSAQAAQTEAKTEAQTSENRLAILFDSLRSCEVDSTKDRLSAEISQELGDILRNPESFKKDFKQLPNLGKVYSDDKKVRIYTWSYPYADRSNGYGGFIQTQLKEKVVTTPLIIQKEAYRPNQQGKIATNNWYGSLYYKVFLVKNKREKYYIALGWSGYDAASDFKIIETINIDNKGNASFGKMVFEKKGKNDSRIILEYGSEAKIALNYDASSKRIIFDHLSPIEPGYKDLRVYYGPDFTYDAYNLKKGIWTLTENIDARNSR